MNAFLEVIRLNDDIITTSGFVPGACGTSDNGTTPTPCDGDD